MFRTTRTPRPGNALLAALTRHDREHVIESSDEVELDFGKPLCMPGEPITHVYFPLTSYISLITPPGATGGLEVGLVGLEGVFGITLLLDVRDSPLLALIQGGGSALRMSAGRFRRAASERSGLQRVLNRYMYVRMAQLAQSAACNRFHRMDARVARWLLMTHDRAHSGTFHVTHEFLARMLGTRRAGVTKAAGTLQKLKLIRYHRGEVTVLDRAGLEALSCPCYRLANDLYHRHLTTRTASR